MQVGRLGSMIELYRRAIFLRHELLTEGEVPLRWLDLGAEILAFERAGALACVVNLSADPVRLPAGEILLASGVVDDHTASPDTAVWLRPG
jgi:alpha-glucosidase